MSDTESKTNLFALDVDVGLLIRLVQNFPYLYNNKLAEFKNMPLRERTWAKIAATLKIPVEDCQRFWRNLRDKYGKEKRLRLEHPGSDSKWEFYDLMHFLKPFVKRRRRTRRILRRYKPCKIEYKEESNEDASNSSFSDKKMWEPIEIHFSSDDIAMLDNEFDENGETEEITLETDTTDDVPLKQVDAEEETISIVRHHSSEEAFGAYVASRLMDFAEDDRQSKKVKIFKILEDLEELS